MVASEKKATKRKTTTAELMEGALIHTLHRESGGGVVRRGGEKLAEIFNKGAMGRGVPKCVYELRRGSFAELNQPRLSERY